jgi:regulator of protease activity HflC (stomatin/prohibitin superfamily)
MRSEIGKLELDRTFEEREKINSTIIQAKEFRRLAKENNTVIIPSDLSDNACIVTNVTSLLKSSPKIPDMQ